jgi:inner membrane transporter RhtA
MARSVPLRRERPAAAPMPPAQWLLVAGALSQYLGSALAVTLFTSVPAAGVAWLRIATAAAVLGAWRRPWRRRALRGVTLARVAAFGLALGLMNLCFYEAIARLPLGTAVAIEFIGPIAVAALGSRTRRDAVALALAVAGVVLLADVHVAGTPLGVVFALAAAGFWAAYIVLGHRVARDEDLRPQDGLAAAMVLAALLLAPALVAPASAALDRPGLLAQCVAVGLAASVVPYALEQVAMRHVPRARFALLLSLLPATAALVGVVTLGQVPSTTEAVGIGMVMAASALRSHVE